MITIFKDKKDIPSDKEYVELNDVFFNQKTVSRIDDKASAIIEKDYTAAKLAELVGAGTLLFLTAYDKLTIGKGTPEEKVFDTVSASDLHQYIKDGHFPAVTTFPKVDASIRFVTADKERKAVIANLEKAKEGLAGKTGTTITA